MLIEQHTWTPLAGWQQRGGSLQGRPAQFVLGFGGRTVLEDPARYAELAQRHPGARILLASTSGEITGTSVTEDELTTVAVVLERSPFACAALSITHPDESHALGLELARRLSAPGIAHVFVISDGSLTNGTELARGLTAQLPPGVLVTGGLAGDGIRFQKTLVGLDEAPVPGRVVAIAFYGEHFKSSAGSCGGWSPFGPERIVTKAEGNRLFELDGRSALALYRNYLGDQAGGLPGTGLRFPLSLATPGSDVRVVRTLLSIDDAEQSVTFAGAIPVGSRARFMHASYEDLLDGASRAAEQAAPHDYDLVICVSCVGRRLVLGQRTEEEIDVVRDTFGRRAVLTGFYSYGELAPAQHGFGCQLHNQTMTVTAFAEL